MAYICGGYAKVASCVEARIIFSLKIFSFSIGPQV